MNQIELFNQFLNELKSNNPSLIESIKIGFNSCFESEENVLLNDIRERVYNIVADNSLKGFDIFQQYDTSTLKKILTPSIMRDVLKIINNPYNSNDNPAYIMQIGKMLAEKEFIEPEFVHYSLYKNSL